MLSNLAAAQIAALTAEWISCSRCCCLQDDVRVFVRSEERADEELARRLCEYADERESAGRSVPHSVWIVSARYPRPGLVARLIGRLEHPNEEERKVAILSLKSAQDTRAVSFLKDRLEREEAWECQALIKATLDALS